MGVSEAHESAACPDAAGQAQLDVRLDLPGVLHGGVEQPELHRAFGEHTVEVQGVVPGSVVVLKAPVLAAVPDLLKGLHGLGPFAVELPEETLVGGLAATPAGLVYLECLE